MTITFYLGKVGALVGLQDPLPGASNASERQSMERSTIGGGRVVAFSPAPGRRRWDMQWGHLDQDQAAIIEGFYAGSYGPGPFLLLDTARRNHLTIGQSSATSVDASAAGFTVAAGSGEAVASAAELYQRGPRSLRWTLPATVTSGVLTLDPPAGQVGVPAPAGLPWTFSGSLYVAGEATSVTVTPVLSWRRTDGSEVSITSGTPVVVATAWSSFTVSASGPPAGSVGVVAQLRVTPGAIATGAAIANVAYVIPSPSSQPASEVSAQVFGERTLVVGAPRRSSAASFLLDRSPITTTDVFVDSLQLDLNATARAWVPGTGVPLVSVVGNPSSYPVFTPYRATSLQLVEVG